MNNLELNKWYFVSKTASRSTRIQNASMLLAYIIFGFLMGYIMNFELDALIILTFMALSIIPIIFRIIRSSKQTTSKIYFTENEIRFVSFDEQEAVLKYADIVKVETELPVILRSYSFLLMKTKKRQEQEDYYHQPIGKDGLPLGQALKAVALLSVFANSPRRSPLAGHKLFGDILDIKIPLDADVTEAAFSYIKTKI